MLRIVSMLSALVLLSGCGLFGRPTFTCPTNSHPCGNGCIPTNAVCCDDGSGATSSYCTNGATGCFANDRGCDAAFPSGVKGRFCCGEAGSVGSNDCPEGQKHCGLSCVAESAACCPAGAKAEDCPEMSWDPSGCSSAKAGYVGCGVCLTTQSCVACPPGFCCQGGLLCGGGQATCIKGAACTGDGSGTSGGGQCDLYTEQCGTSGGLRSLGSYYPKACACPGSMRDEGGAYDNQLCGVPGAGYDCKFCSCP